MNVVTIDRSMNTADIIAICAIAVQILIWVVEPLRKEYASKLSAANIPKRKKHISFVSRFLRYVLPVIIVIFVTIFTKVITKIFILFVAVTVIILLLNFFISLIEDIVSTQKEMAKNNIELAERSEFLKEQLRELTGVVGGIIQMIKEKNA